MANVTQTRYSYPYTFFIAVVKELKSAYRANSPLELCLATCNSSFPLLRIATPPALQNDRNINREVGFETRNKRARCLPVRLWSISPPPTPRSIINPRIQSPIFVARSD